MTGGGQVCSPINDFKEGIVAIAAKHILKDTPLAVSSGLEYQWTAQIQKKFTLVDNFEEPFQLYKRKGENTILVPWSCGPQGGKDKRILGAKVDLLDKFIPRNDEQLRVVSESNELLQAGTSHVVRAPTGFGKTIVGATLTAKVGRKTLVIVPKEDLMKQWVQAYEIVCGLKPSEVGIIKGDVCQVAGKSVVIAMVHSICKDGRYPSWVYKDFGFIICDETHRMGAEQFSNAMWLFPAALRLGVSATPYRKDGRDIIFKTHIGEEMVSSDAAPMEFKVIRLRSRFKLPRVTRKVGTVFKAVPLPHSPGKTMHVAKLLASDHHRNTIIVTNVVKAYDKGRNIVVFSDLKDGHLPMLKAMLQKEGIPSKDIGFYVGGLKDHEKETAKAKRVVLTTYKMCSEGTDAPWWDTAFLGTPRSDVDQIVGRILREYDGKKEPVVFDLVDLDSDVFKAYAGARLNFYKKRGAKVIMGHVD